MVVWCDFYVLWDIFCYKGGEVEIKEKNYWIIKFFFIYRRINFRDLVLIYRGKNEEKYN